jgi:phosphoglycerol transferase MdoB-like AlkP superfamily enzyme
VSVYELRNVYLLFSPAAGDVVSLMKEEAVFVLDFAFLPFLVWRLWRTSSSPMPERARGLAFVLLLGVISHVPLVAHMFGDDESVGAAFWDRPAFASVVGVIDYHVFDIYSYLSVQLGRVKVTQEDVRTVEHWFKKRNDRPISDNAAWTGTGEGMNLIFLQVESLQNFVVGRRWKGREITPNLNRLARKGVHFENIYDQTADGNTSDAAFMANCSLYPAQKGAVAFLYVDNRFDSLPRALAESGYSTATMHAFRKSFWNRENFEKALGFEHQFYEEEYRMVEKKGWGLSDKAFLVQSAEKISSLRQPFYALVVTLTSHTDYSSITAEDDDFPLGNLEGTLIGNYVRSIHYVDSAIGLFLDELSERGLDSRSVLVVYGDHRARFTESDIAMLGVRDVEELRKVPVVIYVPGSSLDDPGDPVGGLIDLAPTVLNILGIDASGKFFMGSDLSGREGGFVLFRDGSFKGSLEELSTEHLKVSDLIIKKDLIPLLNNNDELASSGDRRHDSR